MSIVELNECARTEVWLTTHSTFNMFKLRIQIVSWASSICTCKHTKKANLAQILMKELDATTGAAPTIANAATAIAACCMTTKQTNSFSWNNSICSEKYHFGAINWQVYSFGTQHFQSHYHRYWENARVCLVHLLSTPHKQSEIGFWIEMESLHLCFWFSFWCDRVCYFATVHFTSGM